MVNPSLPLPQGDFMLANVALGGGARRRREGGGKPATEARSTALFGFGVLRGPSARCSAKPGGRARRRAARRRVGRIAGAEGAQSGSRMASRASRRRIMKWRFASGTWRKPRWKTTASAMLLRVALSGARGGRGCGWRPRRGWRRGGGGCRSRLPVAAVPGQQAVGAGAPGVHGRDAVGGLGGGGAGLDDGPLADHAERLAGVREGGERARQEVARGDAPRLDAAVPLGRAVGVAADGRRVPVDGLELANSLGRSGTCSLES